MKTSEIRPPRLYRITTGVRKPTRPALLLSASLWDLDPKGSGLGLRPAPEGSTWAGMNRETGVSRGLLVVHSRPNAPLSDTEAAEFLQPLVLRAQELGFPDATTDRLQALAGYVKAPYVFNVVLQRFVIEPWDRPRVRYACPGTEDVECGTPVSPAASSRLRNHRTPSGQPCPRSNTPLTAQEREEGRLDAARP